jgi:hypothetical protein
MKFEGPAADGGWFVLDTTIQCSQVIDSEGSGATRPTGHARLQSFSQAEGFIILSEEL